jgi:hypothetical protein
MAKKKHEVRRFPVISRAAEHLVQGYLMRRDILTYQAPPNNEGYDLACVNSDPSKAKQFVRVQVKSRYASDAEHWVPIAEKTLDCFDFLVVVFLNVGNFAKNGLKKGANIPRVPEFYTFPCSFVKEHHRKSLVRRPRAKGGQFEWLDLKGEEVEQYRGIASFNQIANALGVDDPCSTQQLSAAQAIRRK